jgi:transposase
LRDRKGLDDLINLPVAHVVAEATSGFEMAVARALAGVELRLCIVNPRQIRDLLGPWVA